MFDIMRINQTNIRYYRLFDEQYDAHLQSFMSRYYPYDHDDFIALTDANLLRWYYMILDNIPIGSIWLEKKDTNDINAKLGIFIADEKNRSKGYGQQAIEMLIEQSAGAMRIEEIYLNVRANNAQAIRCYKKCSFREIENDHFSQGIETCRMVRYIHNNS